MRVCRAVTQPWYRLLRMITSFIGYHSGRKGAARTLLVLAVISLSCGSPPPSQKLSIAAAADLNFAMQDIAAKFRAAHPAVQLDVAYGSSGNFFAQIGNRAPFDMFLSADVEYPRKLSAAGFGAGNPVFTYAVGRIVVWVPAASPLDPATALRDPSAEAPGDRQPAACALRPRRAGRAAIAGTLPEPAAEACAWGEYLPDAAVCGERRRRCGDRRAVAGARASGSRSRPILGDSRRRVSADGAGRHYPEGFRRPPAISAISCSPAAAAAF